MPFIDDILQHKSLSIVGMEKNTGKTECLNYVLDRLKGSGKQLAITSIGIDGESIDQVTLTQKPEIELCENMLFITSEKHYKQRRLTSEVLNISERRTSLGRLVTARALSTGKVILSGPTDTSWLKSCIQQMAQLGVDLTIIDGALSRKSLGSPAITECMILNTGAAVSSHFATLIKKTQFIHQLIQILPFESPASAQLLDIEQGLWAIDENHEIHNLEIPSVFLLEQHKDQLFKHGYTIYAPGAIGDKLLDFLRVQKHCNKTVLVVKDYTRLFVSKESYLAFLKKGGTLKVLLKTKLIAVCVNPTAPTGFAFNSEDLCQQMSETLGIPVYDVRKIEK
jgi:hypothetical protein